MVLSACLVPLLPLLLVSSTRVRKTISSWCLMVLEWVILDLLCDFLDLLHWLVPSLLNVLLPSCIIHAIQDS